MPTRYYVTTLCHHRGKKRLCGPFEHHRQAGAMIDPVRRAVADDPEYRDVAFNVESVTIGQKRLNAGSTFPIGALDPSRIAIDDVIEAAAKHKALYHDR